MMYFRRKMAPIKSNFMFFVRPGRKVKFEVEASFFNNSSKALEPLSSAPQSVPREKKLPFGPIKKMVMTDEQVFKILNEKNEQIELWRKKLSPFLDEEDTMLKNIIIDYETCSTEALVGVLNSVIDKFHSEAGDCLNVEVKTNSSHDSLPSLDESQSIDNNDTSNSKELNHNVSFSLLDKSDIFASSSIEDLSDHTTSDNDTTMETLNNEEDFQISKVESCFQQGSSKDLSQRISEIIHDAQFVCIDLSLCTIPDSINVDTDVVSKLKEALLNKPDKTQCLVGVVDVIEREDEVVVNNEYLVYVNAEMCVALKQVCLEEPNFCRNGKVAAIVHKIFNDEALSYETLGTFLNKNSKDFTAKMRESMLYQDLVRFSITTVLNQGQGEDVKQFIRESLLHFNKGKTNTPLYIFMDFFLVII